MTSIADICNMGLSECGTRAQRISSLADPGTVAGQCSLWYDTMRKRLLRGAPWGMARRQVVLTQLGDLYPDQTSPYPFLYKYAYPADCLKFRYIICPPVSQGSGSITPPAVGLPVGGPSWMMPSRNNRFLVHNDTVGGVNQKVILSNVQGAIGIYTGDQQDPDQFDDLFIGALASALAFKLVIPLSGNVGQRESFKQAAQEALDLARAADGNETIAKTDHQAEWITARGVNIPFGLGQVYGAGNWGMWYDGYDDMAWGS